MAGYVTEAFTANLASWIFGFVLDGGDEETYEGAVYSLELEVTEECVDLYLNDS